MMGNSSNKILDPVSSLIMLLIFVALIGSSGCALQNTKFTKAPRPQIAVPLFKNLTFEPLLEKTITPIFKTALYERDWSINEQLDQSVRMLVGQITHFGRQPISLDPFGNAREYRINMRLKVSLLESADGKEQFSKTVEGIAEYIAQSDSAKDRLAENRAIREAGRHMANQVAELLNHPSTQRDQLPE